MAEKPLRKWIQQTTPWKAQLSKKREQLAKYIWDNKELFKWNHEMMLSRVVFKSRNLAPETGDDIADEVVDDAIRVFKGEGDELGKGER